MLNAKEARELSETNKEVMIKENLDMIEVKINEAAKLGKTSTYTLIGWVDASGIEAIENKLSELGYFTKIKPSGRSCDYKPVYDVDISW